MRRVCRVFVFFAVQVLCVAPAQAWWEFIEGFSGPKVWNGWDIEARLVCFNKVAPQFTRAADRLPSQLAAVQDRLNEINTLVATARVPDDFLRLQRALASLGAEIAAYRATVETLREFARTRIQPGAVTLMNNALVVAGAAEMRAQESEKEFAQLFQQLVAATTPRGGPAVPAAQPPAAPEVPVEQRTALLRPVTRALADRNIALANLDTVAQLGTEEIVAAAALGLLAVGPSAGLMFTACPLQKDHVRQSSIDIGFHFNRSKDDEFANGQQVTLMMVTPSYSWRLNPVMDAGTGGGVYWFSSHGERTTPEEIAAGVTDRRGIVPFRGVMLEPIRFDFHAPRRTTSASAAFWSGFMARTGTYWFPAGFEANAFGKNNQKPAEIQWRVAAFYDFEPLREYCNRDGTPRKGVCWVLKE